MPIPSMLPPMLCAVIKLVRFAHNWNNGMLEYWNIGLRPMKTIKKWFFSAFYSQYSIVPLFHHSMLIAQKIATER